MKIIFVGAGGSALTCASIIKSKDPNAEITLFTKRKDFGYKPCELPFYVEGSIKEIFKKPDLKVINEEITRIDPNKKKVYSMLNEYSYDFLVLATGSRPFIPFNLDFKDRVFMQSTDFKDAEKIKEVFNKFELSTKIAIIGAGAISLEYLGIFSKKTKNIDVIEFQDQILPTINKSLADKLMNSFDQQINFMLKTQVNSVIQENNKVIVNMKDLESERIIENEYDYVFIFTGFRSNTFLAKESGIETDKTIIVDEYCKTNKDFIYAIGDCSSVIDDFSKKKIPLMLANKAILDAKVCAFNILGKDIKRKPTKLLFSIIVNDYLIESIGYNESLLKRNRIEFEKLSFESKTRVNGSQIYIEYLISKDNELLGLQYITKDKAYSKINMFENYIYKNIKELFFSETSYTPEIDMPINPILQGLIKKL